MGSRDTGVTKHEVTKRARSGQLNRGRGTTRTMRRYAPFFSSASTSLATSRRVSKTPSPFTATASTSGSPFTCNSRRHLVGGKNIGHVALVELQHVGDGSEVELVFLQMLAEVFERFEVGIQPLLLGIGHEHDAVGAFQNQLAAGLVKNLPRNGIEMEAGFESADGTQVERKKIKK